MLSTKTEISFIRKQNKASALPTGDYSMQVDIEPGDYELITWAGLDDQSFAVPLLTKGVSKREDLTVLTRRNIDNRATGEEGDNHRKAQPAFPVPRKSKKQAFTRSVQKPVTTIDLVKNTNNIRVVIAQVNSNPSQPVTRAINKERFSYAIYDDNGYMNYDNSLLEDDLLTYLPFVTEDSSIKTRAFSDEYTEYPAAIAEISTARLLDTQTPQLEIIDRETGKQLLPSNSLISYLSLLKTQDFIDMPLQEYLDRECRYSMIFFVDENLTMLKSVIQINDWILHINDIEL